MKIHIISIILCLTFYGCKDAYPKAEIIDMNGKGYQIIIVDSCEYITSPHGITHKGNCKYCLARNNKK